MSAPAGWYPDPSDPSRERWWDGAQWTAHQQAGPQPASAYSAAGSYAAPGTYAAQPYAAPFTPPKVNVDTNSVWIWLAIGATILPLFLLFFIDADGYTDALLRMSSGYGGPAALLQWELRVFAVSALSWIVLAGYVVLSWLDWRELRRRGVVLPFHWAWSFLGMLVYVIGRTVVLRRRTVSGGWPPLWAIIGTTVLSFVLGGIWVVVFLERMFSALAMMSYGY